MVARSGLLRLTRGAKFSRRSTLWNGSTLVTTSLGKPRVARSFKAKGVCALSDHIKAAQFVAQRVTVSGSFDSTKKTIEVADMQIYSPSATNAGLQ